MQNTSALLLIVVFFLFPASLHPQETDHMEHGQAPHAHSSAPIAGSPEDIAYSESMHRLNGFFVLLLGCLALLEQRLSNPGWLRWGWPLLFLVSGIYLAINSDPDGWPIGDKGFIESLQDPIIFQHKLAASILLLLGVSEFLRRTRWRLPFLAGVFPTLAILAGVILVFHSHAGHHSFKIVRQHQLMAGTALTIGFTNFLSKRFEAAKRIWPLLILLLGLELFFYSE
jgi:putative copper resistance protein D